MSDESTIEPTVVGQLYNRGAHLGFSRTRRHPSVIPFLYGMKNRIDLIDLEITERQLATAKTLIQAVKASGKSVVLVGTKAEAKNAVEAIAQRLSLPYITERWIGGTLTNSKEIGRRIETLKRLSKERDTNTLVYQTKKERLMIEREIEDLESKFGGLKTLEGTPGVVIVIDPRKEHIAVEECRARKIPIIAISNTDCNVDIISHPVMANDANLETIKFILDQLLSE